VHCACGEQGDKKTFRGREGTQPARNFNMKVREINVRREDFSFTTYVGGKHFGKVSVD